LSRLITSARKDHDEKENLAALRYAFFGGELLNRHQVDELKQLSPAVTCVNFYGATETPQAMSYTIVANDHRLQSSDIVPLGRGISDVQLLVINAMGQLAGVGEVGELYIRTPYLSKGYWRDITLTEERFIVNPFTKEADDKMYKTGDLGSYLPNGEVLFLGRNDGQVKIRGFRIELSEIEATLLDHPAIDQVVVSVWEPEPGDKRLAAYIVLKPGQSVRPRELHTFLKDRLPDYMVPASFIPIESMPLTPNGKVHYRGLPAPDIDSCLQELFAPPQTDVEKTLAEIWMDVIKLNRVGIHENFFELGGHSILATQVVSRIRKTFQIDISLRSLFTTPTIAELSEVIEMILWAAQNQSTSDEITADNKDEFEI
jgi:acyl-CoA synthetase (AMP-forming)/AMP-acid ligase II/acyl carrier protein